MRLAYSGLRARRRRSIIGTLMKRNIAVTASGPATVHHHDGAAARPNSQSPHQNRTSPK
jgi:hypothetical protein